MKLSKLFPSWWSGVRTETIDSLFIINVLDNILKAHIDNGAISLNKDTIYRIIFPGVEINDIIHETLMNRALISLKEDGYLRLAGDQIITIKGELFYYNTSKSYRGRPFAYQLHKEIQSELWRRWKTFFLVVNAIAIIVLTGLQVYNPWRDNKKNIQGRELDNHQKRPAHYGPILNKARDTTHRLEKTNLDTSLR